jgi:hypothetical protein
MGTANMRSTIKRFSTAALVLTIGVLAFAPGAFAQNSSVDTYGGDGGKVQTQIASGGDPSDPSDPGASATGDPGSLPFTGFDIGLAFGGGLLLLGVGASVASLNRRTGTEPS